jgi:hypothetical protein
MTSVIIGHAYKGKNIVLDLVPGDQECRSLVIVV